MTTPDLFLEESIEAARRGVSVRILLSDAFLDPKDPKDNTYTVQFVNDLARREGLDLQARVIRSDIGGIDKIHNKGIVVDDRQVFISSVNWSYNSPANNREVGLIIDHPQIGALYADLFAFDWYNGTPADYPLITEADTVNGYVEIANFGQKAVELSGWTLSTSAGEWTLPSRTVVYPGKPLVVARDAVAMKAKYGLIPTLVEVPGLVMRSDRDTVQLRRPERGRLVDAVSWGEHQPGWKLSGPARGPVCRENPGKDTNTHLDWVQAAKGTPGAAGCGR